MTKPALEIAALAAALGVLPAPPAGAVAPTKAWVSNAGVDSGTCGAVAAPCATFQQAHDNLAGGGEIGTLTPGDYGKTSSSVRLTISKTVFITNDGSGEASVLVGTGGTGIQINGGNGDLVNLRGLVIDGQLGGLQGIAFLTGSALHVQNCVIRNFEGSGAFAIAFQRAGTGSHTSQLFVSDTIIFNNGSNTQSGGILIQPLLTNGANAVLDRLHLENNVRGLWVDGAQSTGAGAHVVVRDSVMSGNAGDGIIATTVAGHAAAFLVVERSALVNNAGNGILATGPGATVLLGESTLTDNGAGVSTVNSGQLISYGNNQNNNNVGPEGTASSFDLPF